ncbi:MAG: hypothetical protein HQK75_05685 [Candidatus Magnetomorum sp.]|nr:hypothetical protein [Candidatus Magnetomorum sp.]
MSVSDNNELSLLSNFKTPGSAMDIELAGNTAFIADGTAGLQIIDINDPMNPELLQTIDVSSEATGINISGTTLCLTTVDKGFFIFNSSVILILNGELIFRPISY